jgi:methylated-DNA-[protein]-cysteine S-methyltransferase
VFETPWGWVGLAAGAKGLVRVVLPGPRRRPDLDCLAGRGRAPAPARAIAARAEREVREYLAGRRRTFSVPVDLDGLPPFQRKVLLAERRVPYGRTITYGALAAKVGRPRAARAVGQALAHNPVPLVVPCHRVIAAGGGLGGFGGGLALKRRLLALEGAG